jgi:hypothetical protein
VIALKPLWKQTLGAKLEQFSHDVFDAFRWVLTVGVARYIAIKTESALFMSVSHGLSIVLLIFLLSVFLLRGEIILLRQDSRTAKVINMIVNMGVCIAVFISCIWLTYAMVDVFVAFQEISLQ